MCVIIGLNKGQYLSFDKLKNAALNNPHGFGIVTTNDGKLEVWHRYNEKGNDPEEVQRELEKRKDAEFRYLHLRFATKGEKNKDNTHPFTVLKTKDHRIEFMHNGSLSRHVNFQNNVESDSKQFAKNFLSPVLERWHGDNGQGDIEDPLLSVILDEYFNGANRGLLISNILDPLYLGRWSTVICEDGESAPASNDDYFKNTIFHRMTEFYKPKTENIPAMIEHSRGPWRPNHNSSTTGGVNDDNDGNPLPLGTATMKPATQGPAPSGESATQTSTNTTQERTMSTAGTTRKKIQDRDITALKDVNLAKTGRFLIPADIDGLFSVVDGEIDDELIRLLSMCTLLEFGNYTRENPDGAARLLEHIFLRCDELIAENDKLIEKNFNASQMIAGLKKQIAAMEARMAA